MAADDNKCNVVLMGMVLPGFEHSGVVTALAEELQQSRAVIAKLLSGDPTMLAVNLEIGDGLNYVSRLASLGVAANIEIEGDEQAILPTVAHVAATVKETAKTDLQELAPPEEVPAAESAPAPEPTPIAATEPESVPESKPAEDLIVTVDPIAKRTRKTMILLGVALFLLAAAGGSGWYWLWWLDKQEAERIALAMRPRVAPLTLDKMKPEAVAELAATELAKRLPLQITATTKVDAVTSGPGAQVNFRLLFTAATKAEFKTDEYERDTRRRLCEQADNTLLRFGVDEHFTVFDAQQQQLLDFTVSNTSCAAKQEEKPVATLLPLNLPPSVTPEVPATPVKPVAPKTSPREDPTDQQAKEFLRGVRPFGAQQR